MQASVTVIDFIAHISRDEFAAPSCYYRTIVNGVLYEQEKGMPAERYVVKVPYLFVSGMQDVICLPEGIEQEKSSDLTSNTCKLKE